jgi:hypothetical protein
MITVKNVETGIDAALQFGLDQLVSRLEFTSGLWLFSTCACVFLSLCRLALAWYTPRFRLRVVQGVGPGEQFAIRKDAAIVGRPDDQPVDIDLERQETPDRVWVSRRHARIELHKRILTIEDLHSANGTWVNRVRLVAGQRYSLKKGDRIHIGTVLLEVLS